MAYFLYLATLVMLYVVLAYALDIVLGQAGILPVCHAGFCGVGAYVAALLSLNHFNVYLAELAIAAGFAAVISLLVSIPSLRLHDDYFVLATFAFQIVFTHILTNWSSVTNGSLGLRAIPPPNVFHRRLASPGAIFLLAFVLSCLAVIVVTRIARSPFGRVLRAIRSDEIFAQALGKNTVRFKVLAFMVVAALASMAGVTYAHFITYIDPTSFDVGGSILVMSMVIIGGAGSRYGPAVGAALLVLIPEALRFLRIPTSVGPNIKEVIFSLMLLLILLLRPRGLVGSHDFGK